MSQEGPLVKDWIEKAESDLRYAEASFENFDDFYSQICILCHDAVEKYLKACLIFHNVEPKKIHDLVALFKQCIEISNDNLALSNFEDKCRTLNLYYVPLKYPSHYPAVDRNKAKEAIEIAKEISEIIKNKLELCE